MLDHHSLLHLFAQVFIAFAGFAGVVGAFSSFRISHDVTGFRVRVLVVAALSGLVASLLPFLPIAFGASEIVTLRISSFIFAVMLSVIAFWNWRQAVALFRTGALHTQTLFAIMNALAGTVIVGLFVVAAGPLAEFALAIFLGGLFYTVIACSYFFIMTLLAVDIGAGR